jgi:hypothetical protein
MKYYWNDPIESYKKSFESQFLLKDRESIEKCLMGVKEVSAVKGDPRYAIFCYALGETHKFYISGYI